MCCNVWKTYTIEGRALFQLDEKNFLQPIDLVWKWHERNFAVDAFAEQATQESYTENQDYWFGRPQRNVSKKTAKKKKQKRNRQETKKKDRKLYHDRSFRQNNKISNRKPLKGADVVQLVTKV